MQINLPTITQPYQTLPFPFRNMRDVLGLHAKVSSRKIAVISYDAQFNRSEMTYLELVGKSHQVANFLYEDLGIQRGDAIAIISPNHENALLIYFAAWVIGASVVAIDNNSDQLADHLYNSPAKILFADHTVLAQVAPIANAIESIDGVIQIGGERQDDFLRFEDLAANRPTTFLGDESGAKGADIPLVDGNERTASLQDDALIVYKNDKLVKLTQERLLFNAAQYSSATALMGNQTVIASLPLSHDFAESILAPLFVGATLILTETFMPDTFWNLIVQQNAHSGLLNADQIEQMVTTGEQHISEGKMRFGGKVIQQDVKHFRHITTFDTSLSPSTAHAFEECFGIPILTGLKHLHSDEIITLMPTTLSWHLHQLMLHGHETLGIGVPMHPIIIADDNGKPVSEGEVGNIVLLTESEKRLPSGVKGYYIEENKQRFIFLA